MRTGLYHSSLSHGFQRSPIRFISRRPGAFSLARFAPGLCALWFGLAFISASFGAVLVVSPSGGAELSLEAAVKQARNGDEIVLQPGTHRIQPAYPSGAWKAPLQLIGKTNITIRGLEAGAEILGEGPGEFLILAGCSSIRFDNLTFRGNKAPVQPADWLYSMIMLQGPNEKLTFENCRFLDFGNHAISQLWGIKQSTDVIVRNCYFADGGDRNVGDGAAVSGIGSRWLIESNRVERCLIAFEVEGPWGTNQNITIRKNTILNATGCGIVVFATSGKSSDFSDIEISDNLIKDAVKDSAQATPPLGILIGGGERIRVSRNRIENCAYTGILAHAQWADLRGCIIEGNTISNAGFSGIQVYEFLNHRTSDVLVRSNAITTAATAGIKVAGRNIRIHDNTIYNTGWLGVYGGIEIENSGSGIPTANVGISGNTIGNLDSQFQDYGIRVRSGVQDVRIAPNRFQDNVVSAIFDEGAGTTVETRILETSFPTWVLGSTVNIFAPPKSRGRIQTSANLNDWFEVYSFVADNNGAASVLITADMIMVGRRYYRAIH